MRLDSWGRRLTFSVFAAGFLVMIGMVWTGESKIREAIQATLSWFMAPGIIFGFAIGNYAGHDFQWPYLIAIATNFGLYSMLFFILITLLMRAVKTGAQSR